MTPSNVPTFPQFQFLTYSGLLDLPSPTWLVEDLLPEHSFALLYGKPGAGKSFVALDLACSIATGLPFHGHEVRQGPVVYVVAEAASGMKLRARAWAEAHGLADIPGLCFIPHAVQLIDRFHRGALLDGIREHMPHPQLIILDTMSRCFAGKDENGSVDMGQLIEAVDQIQRKSGAGVQLLHHPGKNERAGSRGHTSLWAAIDMGWCLTETATGMTLSCEKPKDSEPFAPLHLRLEPAGESCVVRDCDEAPISGPQREALRVLGTFPKQTASIAEWHKALNGPTKRTLQNWKTQFLRQGLIRATGHGVVTLESAKVQSGEIREIAA
jgi:hypothetical protein